MFQTFFNAHYLKQMGKGLIMLVERANDSEGISRGASGNVRDRLGPLGAVIGRVSALIEYTAGPIW